MRFNNDKGVAGLTILLSVVTMLFVIGLLIMIYSLMGGELGEVDTVARQFTSTSFDQNGSTLSSLGTSLTVCASATLGSINSIVLLNGTGTDVVAPEGNYTTADCVVTMLSASDYNNSVVNVTYDYTYAGDTFSVINDTISAIADTTDWFPIFIVITAMVVLVLLTVIIIVSIRGSGLMGGTSEKGGNVGSA